ncbi:AAA family ATPase, partial [Natronococcus sp. A-GB1]|uniref:Cdc6/Cdc18 family protein n=1 Tax=Natronococcus sp. A-GB1 TaxID=3037648 RepID=UPI00241CE39B
MTVASVAMFDDPDRQHQLFRAESTLSTRYTPDTIVGRDTEIDALETALAPLTRRTVPENVLVYGPAGVGKTTTVTHVCEELEADTRVRTAAINCWQYNTRAALLSQLLIELGYPAPRKGNPVDELLRTLHEWVAKHQSLAIVLDEFDRQRAQTEIIYDLYHVSADVDNELGVVLI